MLSRIESGQRELDSTAQEVLAKYVGWGGLSEVFDESREGQWKEARSFLKENLSQAEYEAARESTLTSFYTPKTVIDGIYKTLSDMGFKQKNISLCRSVLFLVQFEFYTFLSSFTTC